MSERHKTLSIQLGKLKEETEQMTEQLIKHGEDMIALLKELESWVPQFDGYKELEYHDYFQKFHMDPKPPIGKFLTDRQGGLWLAVDNSIGESFMWYFFNKQQAVAWLESRE